MIISICVLYYVLCIGLCIYRLYNSNNDLCSDNIAVCLMMGWLVGPFLALGMVLEYIFKKMKEHGP